MEQSNMAAPLPAYADQMLSGLGPPELIRLMIGDEDRVPRNVVDECARRGEEMVRALENATGAERFWQGDAALGEWWLRLHAVMILGLIASERAGLALVSFMRRMARARDDDLDDWLSGYWPALFRNKPETVVAPLRELAHDRSVEWSMRTEAVESVVALGERHGAEALEAALDWAAATAADPSEDSMLRQSLFDLLVDFPRERHRALLESFARQSEMEGTFAEEAVREAFSGVEDTPLWRDFADLWDFYAPEAIAGRQAEEDPAGEDVEAEEVELEDFFGGDEPPIPYVRPDAKVGRNDPCPCGSGKKYKRCCLAAQTERADTVDPVWERLHRFNDQSPAKMLRFADELFGSAALAEAWDEFTLGKGVAFDPQSLHLQAFMPWFFYDWTPDESATRIRKSAPRGATVAGAYLRLKGRHLDPLERRYLEACLAAPFSFHEVLECRPGQGFRLRDILTGEERDVSERSGSRGAQKGDIMFAKVVPIEHLALVDGCSPVVIGPSEKAPIIELRRALQAKGVRLAAESLRAHAPEIFKVYHALAGPLREFGTPELRNTDGDVISFHRLVYEIDSPQAAFDALKELALDAPEEELLSRSERDTSGALKKVEFGWLERGNAQHKHWDNTVLGHISIDGSTLAVEVNSRRRADAFRALAEERLKGCARYRTATVEPAGAMLERARRDKDSLDESRRELDELNARPEVQALVADQLQAHYAAWPDQRLPALGGRTPLEAVQDPDGREMVEALLLDIGRLLRAQLPGRGDRIAERLRERLGFA